jgi:hypothetical protein
MDRRPINFDRASGRRIAGAVRTVEASREVGAGTPPRWDGGPRPPELFKITDIDPLQGKRVHRTAAGTFADIPPATVINLEDAGNGTPAVDDIVHATLQIASDGSPCYVFVSGGAGGDNLVRIKITGSRNGTTKLYPAALTHEGDPSGMETPAWGDGTVVSAYFPPDVAESIPRLLLNDVCTAVPRQTSGGASTYYEVLGLAIPLGTTLYQGYFIGEGLVPGWDYPRFP